MAAPPFLKSNRVEDIRSVLAQLYRTLGLSSASSVVSPTSGTSVMETYVLPTGTAKKGDNGTLGAGDAGNTAVCEKVDTTTVAFGATSPVAAFTRPANSVVTMVEVDVDTAFDGTAPSLSVGIAGSTAKYMPATALDLKTADIFEYTPGLPAEAASEDIIITFNGDSSTQGSARVQVYYAIPG